MVFDHAGLIDDPDAAPQPTVGYLTGLFNALFSESVRSQG
jgi:hypothetical protein